MPLALCAALVWMAAGVEAGTGATPQASPSPSPPAQNKPVSRGRPPRLRLDIDKHVEHVLEERGELPRFETSVDVLGTAPEVMLARHLSGIDLECGPARGGAPTEVETRVARPHPAPSVDFLALGRVLMDKLSSKSKGPDRYFLYRVIRPDGVGYALRQERIPETAPIGAGGAMFELVDTFSDRGEATRAWRRLERGLATPAPSTPSSPAPPWVTVPCRPRRE